MKKILAVALLIASAGAMPTVTPAFADSSTDRLCGPDGPEAYKRPGGYCEQIDKKGSLNQGNDCDYDRIPLTMNVSGVPNDRLLVACYAVESVPFV